MIFTRNKSSLEHILEHFDLCNNDFIQNLKKKKNLAEYTNKILNHATRFEFWNKGCLAGLIALYLNQEDSIRNGYITNVSVIESWEKKGIASKLLENCMLHSKEISLNEVKLEVNKNNYAALNLYKKFNFTIFEENEESTFMRNDLRDVKIFRWEKLGKIFNPVENKISPWLEEYAQSPSTLTFDDFIRVYFSCRSKRDENGANISRSTYIDLDKSNLFNILNIGKQPVLNLGERGCFDEFGTYPMSVIRNNDEVWIYYAGWTRCKSVPFNTAIGAAISKDDGETFEKIGNGPVIPYSINEPFLMSVPKIRKFDNLFYLFYVCGHKWMVVDGKPEMSLKIRFATSSDGKNWEKANRDIIEEASGPDESQGSPDVIFRNGKYHMFFDYWDPNTFRKTKSRKIGYAYSPDLINWMRDDSRAGIDVSEKPNAFDNEMVAYPHVFELNKEVYMLYLGNEVGRYGFGLAKLNGDL